MVELTVEGHPILTAYADLMHERAEQWRTESVSPLPFSSYRLYADTGSRAEYETLYFSRRRRLTELAIDALLDPLAETASIEDTIWAICDEYTWALPAHVDDLLSADPKIPHRDVVDLFAGETAFALAEVCHLLSNRLSDLVVQRASAEIRSRVFGPFRDRSFWWEDGRANWTAVCSGSIGLAALYLLDPVAEAAELDAITKRVVRNLRRFVNGYGDDGVCLEGLGYWRYGFGYFVMYACELLSYSGGRQDLLDDPKVARIAEFQQHAFLSGNVVAAFADSEPWLSYDPALTGILARQFPTVLVPDTSLLADDPVDDRGRWGLAIRAFRHPPAVKGTAPVLPGRYFPDAQWIIARGDHAGRVVAFAGKAGSNNEPHNHNDVGSFVYVVDGQILLADLGSGQYNQQYFGAGRYDILCNGSQGHSVPIVNGQYQTAGPQTGAVVEEASADATHSQLRMDLSAAYPCSGIRIVRDFSFTGAELTVTDDLQADHVVERFMSFLPITLTAPGVATIYGLGVGVELWYDARSWRACVRSHEHTDHQGRRCTVHSLDLSALEPNPSFHLRIRPLIVA